MLLKIQCIFQVKSLTADIMVYTNLLLVITKLSYALTVDFNMSACKGRSRVRLWL